MNDTSKNILLSDVQGQGFLSIFNDLSSELMPHELSLLELMEGLDYNGFDSSLKRDASVDPKDMAIIIVYSYIVRANRKGKIRVSRKGTMNSQEKRDIKPY